MRFVRFNLSEGMPLILTFEQAERALNSQNQIVRILDEDGQWTGITLNKAHIISTYEDYDAEEDYVAGTRKRLPPPREKRDPARVQDLLEKVGRELKEKLNWNDKRDTKTDLEGVPKANAADSEALPEI